MEFSRQEYWSELPLPSPVDLPDPGIEPVPPALQVGNEHYLHIMVPSLVAQMIKCLPAVWETWVQSLGQEDPTEYLAWKFPWTEEPGRLQSMGLQRVGHN